MLAVVSAVGTEGYSSNLQSSMCEIFPINHLFCVCAPLRTLHNFFGILL